jgi:hypothetical protein
MSSVTGNSDNIFINNANLKIAHAGKGLMFSDGTIMYTAPPNSDPTNTAYFSNGINAFIITETTANTGFAGNTAPTDAISVSSNLFISYTGNLITYGQLSAGSVANVESNILTLETDLSDNSSRIDSEVSNIVTLQSDLSDNSSRIDSEVSNVVTLQSDLSDNSSRIDSEVSNVVTLQTKTTDITWSGDVTTVANDLTVGGDLTVTGNVITSNNIQTNDPFFMIASNVQNDTTNSGYMFGRDGSNVMISHYPNSGDFGNVVISYTTSGANTSTAGIDFDNNLSLYVQGNITANTYFSDGTLANLSANIVTLESDLSDNSSRILTISTDLSDNSSRIGLYETNIQLEGFKVGINPSDFIPSANLHVVGNVYSSSNLDISGWIGINSNHYIREYAGSATDRALLIGYDGNTDRIGIGRNKDGSPTLNIYDEASSSTKNKVGINTVLPSANLHVVGNICATSNIIIGSSTTEKATLMINSGNKNSIEIEGSVYPGIGFTETDSNERFSMFVNSSGVGSPNHLGFYSSAVGAEVMAISNTGAVGIGTTSPGKRVEIQTTGNDHLRLQYSSGYFWDINRNTDGGKLYFTCENGNKMNLTINGDLTIAGTYSPFTGSHTAINSKVFEDGSILISTGTEKESIINTSFYVDNSMTAKDKRVVGVAYTENYFTQNTNVSSIQIVALGEGQMLVCNENGDIENGDYICSSNVAGHGMKQDDDLLHNYTVAKATEDCSFTGPDDKKLVSVTFHCG